MGGWGDGVRGVTTTAAGVTETRGSGEHGRVEMGLLSRMRPVHREGFEVQDGRGREQEKGLKCRTGAGESSEGVSIKL